MGPGNAIMRMQKELGESSSTLPLLDQCEKVFCSYTSREAHKQQSKVKIGGKLWLFGDLISLIAKGVTIDEAKALVESLDSIAKGRKTRAQLEEVVKGTEKKEGNEKKELKAFPDNIVEDYAKNLLKEDKALKTFKKEYSGGDEQTRLKFYETLKGLPSPITASQLSVQLWADLGREGELQFPMLDFYMLLLKNYGEKHRQKEGEKELTMVFAERLAGFLSASRFLASRSKSFEDFDAKMKSLKSLEPPVVKQNNNDST